MKTPENVTPVPVGSGHLVSLWAITVGAGYGTFFFRGTETEAEEMRRHKARWEQAIARKRLATPEEEKSNL